MIQNSSVLARKLAYVENVIPAERAAARESRNPGKYEEKPRFPLQPKADPSEALWRIRGNDERRGRHVTELTDRIPAQICLTLLRD
jgi:hypothetical protein